MAVTFLWYSVPGKIIAPLNAVKTYNYIAYPFLVIPNYLGAGLDVYFQSLRFCGTLMSRVLLVLSPDLCCI